MDRDIDSKGFISDYGDVDCDKDGNFTVDVYLKLGENQVVVSAMDRYENRASKTVSIVRKASLLKPSVRQVQLADGRYHALVIGNNQSLHIS